MSIHQAAGSFRSSALVGSTIVPEMPYSQKNASPFLLQSSVTDNSDQPLSQIGHGPLNRVATDAGCSSFQSSI
jgi:hypothetical protein